MCSCSNFDPDFQSVTRVRARKAHDCAECGKPIKRGDLYDRVAIGFDGRVDVYQQCIACGRLNHAYHALSTEDCNPPWGELRECVAELLRNDPTTLEREIAAAFLAPSKWEWQHIEFARTKGAAA